MLPIYPYAQSYPLFPSFRPPTKRGGKKCLVRKYFLGAGKKRERGKDMRGIQSASISDIFDDDDGLDFSLFFVSRSWEGKLSRGDCEEIPFGRDREKIKWAMHIFYVLFLPPPSPLPAWSKEGFQNLVSFQTGKKSDSHGWAKSIPRTIQRSSRHASSISP